MTRRRLLLAGLLAGVFTLSPACDGGGDDSPPETSADGATPASDPGPGAPFTVEAGDLFLKPTDLTVPTGAVTFTYVNIGAQAHNLLIDKIEGFKLEVAAKGDTDKGNVELPLGRYTLYCDVPGHRAAGMEANLVAQ
ncbi:MAG: cupredoxin domain-containing protein [Acidimicrobiia bacterium]